MLHASSGRDVRGGGWPSPTEGDGSEQEEDPTVDGLGLVLGHVRNASTGFASVRDDVSGVPGGEMAALLGILWFPASLLRDWVHRRSAERPDRS